MKGKWVGIVIAVAAAAFVAFIMFSPIGKPAKSGKRGTGKNAPDFTLTDTAGRTWKLSELKGSVVVVNFWATWCPPCREELPSLSNLFKMTLGRKDFFILTVLFNDSPERAQKFFKQNNFNMPILVDSEAKSAREYGLTGVPETFVIGRNGEILEHVVGPMEFDTPASIKYFESVLSSR